MDSKCDFPRLLQEPLLFSERSVFVPDCNAKCLLNKENKAYRIFFFLKKQSLSYHLKQVPSHWSILSLLPSV